MARTHATPIDVSPQMAALGLFGMLEITSGPWAPVPDHIERPLVIYGAAGTVGAYAVKLAKLVSIYPLICVAGHGKSFVRSLIDETDTIIDYRKGNDHIIDEIRNSLHGRKLEYAFDATSAHGSFTNLSKVLADGGKLTLVLADKRPEIPSRIQQSNTMAGSLWRNLSNDTDKDYSGLGQLDFARGKEFANMFSRLIGCWVREGQLKPHPYQVVEGGLAGVETALKALKDGKNSTMKYVVRIADTPGLEKQTIA